MEFIRKNKKSILEILFLMLLVVFTFYALLKDQELDEINQVLKTASPGWLIAALVLVIVFVCSESVIIHYMMISLGKKTKLHQCIRYSFIGFFYSCITPSASGGQPAQIYYMSKDGLDVSISTLVLMIVTITYKAVLVLVGFVVLIFMSPTVHTYMGASRYLLYLGMGLNVIAVTSMMILVFVPGWTKRILYYGLRFLEKMHLLKHKRARTRKLLLSMNKYREASVYFRTHKRVVFHVMLITIFQRFCLFFVTWMVYRSFGLSGTPMGLVVILQAVISVAVDMLPLPGGVGVSEGLFMTMFEPVFGEKLLPGMLLSRGISYYALLIISAVLTFIAHFNLARRSFQKQGNTSKKFIGFYDYTVVLTYMSLLSSIVGMTEALDGRFGNAIACLVVSGICDMLDGKVARTKKDRTEDQKNFGIQIDSLCDLFCFGAFPAFLTYALGVRGIVGTISMCVYVLAAVIRLGYFNVKEMRRQQETEERRKSYEGLPVTSISIIFPLIYLLRPYCGHTAYLRILIAVMFIVAFLFVSKIRVLKPGNKLMAFFIVAGLVILGKLLHIY